MSQTIDSYVTDRPETRPKPGPGIIRRIVTALASLRLTVVLFALSFVLVFCGTLAQVDNGIKTVVDNYFHSWLAWIPFQIFVPRTRLVSGGTWFPGGWIVGGGLLINLLAAHAIRFRFTWKRAGIIMLHAGIVLMLVGEFVTAKLGVEARMSIDEGASANYVEDTRHFELAVIDPSDPAGDLVVSVPASLLQTGARVRDDRLPFDIEVTQFVKNSDLEKKPSAADRATDGYAKFFRAVERRETAGTDTQQKIDAPAAYITIRRKGGDETLGRYLVSAWFSNKGAPPQSVDVGDKSYGIDLRFRREYLPYSMRLLEFRFDRWPGTNIPKNYSSEVRLHDPEHGPDRDVLIRMNQPLRYQGQTFYQSSFDEDTEKSTVLQVVHNPAAWIPYVSCLMVFAGMAFHFGLHLIGFLGRRMAS
jgi:hypothetical protein